MAVRQLALVLSAVVTTGLLGAGVATSTPVPTCFDRYYDEATSSAHRISGADRYLTAVCVSYATWLDRKDEPPEKFDRRADAVVLARGDAFPDALAGVPLAEYVDGPLLLNPTDTLRSDVAAEIQRVLSPGGTVYLLGGTASLSQGVADQLTALGYAPERIAGADRFETSVKIATKINEAQPVAGDAFVTTGMDFPDALGAGVAAAQRTSRMRVDVNQYPAVVVFSKDATMPAVTADYLRQTRSPLITAGGAADTATVTEFGAAAISERYVGADRYQTATLIAQGTRAWKHGVLATWGAGLVSGTDFPDALAGGARFVHFGEPLLLTKPTSLPSSTRNYLLDNKDYDYTVIETVGGPSAVSDVVLGDAWTAYTPTT